MRRYTGDLVAIAAIVAGALGSTALYHRSHRAHVHGLDVAPVAGPRGLILPGPAAAPAAKAPIAGGRVLHIRSAEPEGEVYLVRPGRPDLRVRAGSNVLLGGDPDFEGVFRTHGMLRRVALKVELLNDGQITAKASVRALRARVDVSGTQLSVFGAF